MVPKAVSVWMTWEVFLLREESECLRSVAFVVAFLFVASEPSHARHRCSVTGARLSPVPPACLCNVFLPLFTGSDPVGATLASPDKMSSGMGPVTWSLQPGLRCGWYWLCLSNATFSLSHHPSPWTMPPASLPLQCRSSNSSPLFTQDYKPTLPFFILAQDGGLGGLSPPCFL